MKKTTILFLLFFFSKILSAQFSALSNSSFNQVQSYVSHRFSQENMVGLSVGVIKNGEIIFLRGYGYSNLEDSIAASEFTSYRLASVSKFLTAVLALKLADNNLLDLDEDIRNYVPEFPDKPEGIITSRHLLANQSGITHYNQCATYSSVDLQNYVNTYTDTYNPISAIDIFKNSPLCFAPGTDYRYSTFGFNLLAAVIERAGSGTYLEKYNNLIKCPSRMYGLYPEIQDLRPFPNESAWYRNVNGDILPPANSIDLTDISFKTGGGGFTGTVIDMVKFMRAYVNRELLNDSLITLMHTVPQVNDAAGVNYALGTFSAIRSGQRLVFHSGSQTGSASLLYFSPENRNGLILLCNTQNVNLYPLARDIYDYLPYATTNSNTWEDELFETEIDTLINHENKTAVLEALTSGGITPYEYNWSTNESDNIITIHENENISLTTTDKFDCSNTTSIEIYFNNYDTLTISVCDSFLWNQTNLSYNNSGIYYDTIKENGSDSIFVLDLTILPTSLDTIVESACNSFTWNVNSETYFSSGFYADTLSSVYNCDSVVVLDLTILPTSLDTVTESACNSFTWSVNSETYFSSGFYADTLSSVDNCDSVVVLDLTILPEFLTLYSEVDCNEFTWDANGQTYFSSGSYFDTLQTIDGCDSVLQLDLIIYENSNNCDVYIWNGNEDFDWGNSNNWNTVSVPNDGEKIIIPPDRNHYPLLDEDVVIDTLFLDGIIHTNGRTLYIGASENQIGHIIWENGYIDGALSRWIPTNNHDNFIFPIGKNNHLTNVNIQFTDSPNNAGTVVINYKENNTDTLPVGLYDNAVLITNIHPKGYWEINPQNGLSGGTYSVSISNNDMGGLVDVAELRIVKRDNSSQAWQIEGNHVAGTMENGVPTAHRSNLTAFSEFAIASSEANPLPINLLSFNITCEKTYYYTAKWKTLSELNNDIFEVQVSFDLESWKTVAKINGAGNSNTLLDYELGFQVDEKRTIEKPIYFRLKQTDFDGKNSVSSIVYSDCKNENFNLKVYPNPTKNFINIDLDQNIGKVNISITDLYGKTVFNQDFENMTHEKINLENLANGIYTLRIIDSEFNNYNFKIIKN